MRNAFLGAWMVVSLFLYGFSYDIVHADCVSKPDITSCRAIAAVGGVGLSATWPVWLPLYISYRGWEERQ